MNRYADHLYIIPEDDCDRQLADGFVLHDQVNSPRIQVMPPAGGWGDVIKKFQTEYVKHLRQYPHGRVVMLIDFDGEYSNRRAHFDNEIPADLKNRVFVVGARLTPEELKQALGKSFEEIGKSLADACFKGVDGDWGHDHLKHNDPDRNRLFLSVKSFLFT
jgi:hypothetical protein